MDNNIETCVLASIHPLQCRDIFLGRKTLEIRKNAPLLPRPFRMYIYCTLPSRRCQKVSGSKVINTDELFTLPDGTLKHDWSGVLMLHDGVGPDNYLNGKVIGTCVCTSIAPFRVFEDGMIQDWNWLDLYRACLPYEKMAEYVGPGNKGYAWRLWNAVLFDKPKPITEFLTKPPQSWCYVSVPRISQQ